MLIPSIVGLFRRQEASLSRRVNANSQLCEGSGVQFDKLIKKGEC